MKQHSFNLKYATVVICLAAMLLSSCTQRYYHLNKVRVTNQSKESSRHSGVKHKKNEIALKPAAIDSIPTANLEANVEEIAKPDLEIKNSYKVPAAITGKKNSIAQSRPIEKDPQNPPPEPGSLNKSAVIAFISSMLGVASIAAAFVFSGAFILLFLLCALFGVLFGIEGYFQIRKYHQRGKALALTGVFTGFLTAALMVALIFTFSARNDSDALLTVLVVGPVVFGGLTYLFFKEASKVEGEGDKVK